ncbi:hypothetical protein [Anaerocolumna sp. MB42-C2]|uniref:hypothetical protein n=1 Tax=Anaerocolumna sp. MB42-C2 TaxID=3070997 RepID=UPI0027E0D4BF|nr:hypothetical protein [Anaerocolumna sp. MB42-C2]WMJ89768.1 hypothetical protein RBU59_09610 [Anaerocolumna sp. MB42-C2]
MQKLGRKEESRKWFEDWFGEERDNPDCIDSYLWFLLGEEDINGARKLIEEAIPIDMVCNMDNQMLFYRAAAFYETIKETENSKMYRDKAEDFHKKFLENPLLFSDDSEDYVFFRCKSR